MKEDSEGEERTDQVSGDDQENVMEPSAMILLIGIDLLPNVPIFPVKIRDKGPQTDQKCDLRFAKEDQGDG